MNKFGESLFSNVNTSQILKTVDAKITISNATNESKYVNETSDTITCLKITEEPKNLNDAVNLKYIKQLEDKIQKLFKIGNLQSKLNDKNCNKETFDKINYENQKIKI